MIGSTLLLHAVLAATPLPQAAEIFPFAPGATWTFEQTEQDNTSYRSPTRIRKVVRQVTGVESIRVGGRDVSAFAIAVREPEGRSKWLAVVTEDRVDFLLPIGGAEGFRTLATLPRFLPPPGSLTLGETRHKVTPTRAELPAPLGARDGVELRAARMRGGAEVVVLVPGVGIVLEGHQPGPLECMAATSVGPLRLVRFAPGRGAAPPASEASPVAAPAPGVGKHEGPALP